MIYVGSRAFPNREQAQAYLNLRRELFYGRRYDIQVQCPELQDITLYNQESGRRQEWKSLLGGSELGRQGGSKRLVLRMGSQSDNRLVVG